MGRTTYRKVITSPELTQQINTKNKKLSERFLKEKNTRCSDATIKNYASDLNIFFTWNLLHNENKFFVDIRKLELADFFSFCVEELKWGGNRFGRMRACLSSLSDYIEKFYDEDYPKFRNIVLKAIDLMPREPRREKTILSEEQVDGLLNHLMYSLNKPQEACLLALAITSGARLSELLRFDIDIIDEDNTAFNGMFIETLKQIKTKGRTKEGKKLTKYIIKDMFLPYYHTWLKERELIMERTGKCHNSLFIKRDGEPATETTIKEWSKKWDKYLDVPFYFHSLRHYTVTHLTRLGLESDFIIEIMGWSSSDMYKIYNDLTAKDRDWKGLSKLKDHLENKQKEGVI